MEMEVILIINNVLGLTSNVAVKSTQTAQHIHLEVDVIINYRLFPGQPRTHAPPAFRSLERSGIIWKWK